MSAYGEMTTPDWLILSDEHPGWRIHLDFSEGDDPDCQLFAPDGSHAGRFPTIQDATAGMRRIVRDPSEEKK